MIQLLSRSVRKFRGGRGNQERHLERRPTEGNDSFQPECHGFHTVRDFLQRSGLLNVSGEKGNDGTGAYDRYGEQMMPRRGWPDRFPFRIESSEKTNPVPPISPIRRVLAAVIVSSFMRSSFLA